MIQANELRIGNWVFMVGDFVKITSVDQSGINRKDDDHELKVRSYYTSIPGPIGIPLTPEILEKAGFVKGKNRTRVLKVGLFTITYDGESFSIHDSDFSTGSGVLLFHIKSLHQLQNLYFALTGDELNVQL